MKNCSKCGETKPETEFYIHRRYGREEIRAACKECHRKANKKWRESLQPLFKLIWEDQKRQWHKSNPERVRDNGQKYRKRHIYAYRERIKRWKITNPEKTKAHSLARRLNRGLVPTHCQYCGREKPLDKHHHDYSKPLEVIWVCKKCHKAIGGKNNGNKRTYSTTGRDR